jgi:hypothetical protein
MDNLAGNMALPHASSAAETHELPPAPPSLPRRARPLASGEKVAAVASETIGQSVDHLIIVVHGAGTCKETAETHGEDLQVEGGFRGGGWVGGWGWVKGCDV